MRGGEDPVTGARQVSEEMKKYFLTRAGQPGSSAYENPA